MGGELVSAGSTRGRRHALRRAAVLRAALGFWQAAAGDERITPGFRQLCGADAAALSGWAALWAPEA